MTFTTLVLRIFLTPVKLIVIEEKIIDNDAHKQSRLEKIIIEHFPTFRFRHIEGKPHLINIGRTALDCGGIVETWTFSNCHRGDRGFTFFNNSFFNCLVQVTSTDIALEMFEFRILSIRSCDEN